MADPRRLPTPGLLPRNAKSICHGTAKQPVNCLGKSFEFWNHGLFAVSYCANADYRGTVKRLLRIQGLLSRSRTIVNDIAERQNTEDALRLLVAQRRLYSRAKRVVALQLLLSVPFVVMWSFLVDWRPELKSYAGLWGIALTILELWVFSPLQESLKTRAAKAQEQFDCFVLQIDWQCMKVGKRPEAEDVAQYSTLRPGETYDSLGVRDWYPRAVQVLPLHVARIVCQRASCWWDGDLRRRYTLSSAVLTGAVFVFIVVHGLTRHTPFDQFLLSGVLPFLPVLFLGSRTCVEQMQAANRITKLKDNVDEIWRRVLDQATTADELTHASRCLQCEIFDHRKRSALIFDWAYALLRRRHERIMNKTTEQLVSEAINAGVVKHGD